MPHTVENHALTAWSIEKGVVFLETDKAMFHFYFLRFTITNLLCWNCYGYSVHHDVKLY